MKRPINVFRKTIYYALAIIMSVTPLFLPLDMASATSADSLYLYDLRNSAGTVENLAAANAGVDMTFVGDWSSSADGVIFAGNTTNLQSVGHASPSSGQTIDVPGNQAVGAAVIFNQTGGCGSDSQNISQIGPFSTATSQVKLQLSKCRGGKMYPECRIAGQLTPTRTYALRGSLNLASGKDYRLECVKSPDQGSGATVTMRTTDMTTAQSTVNTFSIPATGSVTSSRDVTAGNKYPLPSLNKNTDQFTGTITKVGYCKGSDLVAAQACLDEGVNLDTTPPVDPPSPTSVDEVKYSYGDSRDQVVFNWRGNETTIYYGLDSSYGSQVTASPSAITPVDIEGPFMEARLSGLQPGTTYHYKIGSDGADSVFRTAAGVADSFKAVSVGDTIASTCRTYQDEFNQQVHDQNPDFVLHGGDISLANECGEPAVHQYFQDIETSFSRTAAFMPAWGNHEYGMPTADAPEGTPRDTLANYKGRVAIPNPQTVPSDTLDKISHPGCGTEVGSTTNTCMGEDWGWFVSGRVLFVSFPELWWNAINDWQVKAGALMAQAQDNPDIDFIVTYGHRPVLSSTGWTAPTDYEQVFAYLGDTYSPEARPDGKYVLNITQHRHIMEAFSGYHGVAQVVNGGGGQGLINFQTILPESVYRMKHLGFSTLEYDANSRELTYSMICGPSSTYETTTCAPNQVMYTRTFTRTTTPPVSEPALIQASIQDNATQRSPGETYSYDITVTNTGYETAAGVTATAVLPNNLTLVDGDGAIVSGQSQFWSLGDIAGGQTLTRSISVQLSSDAGNAESITTSLSVASSDTNDCGAGSICQTQDVNTVYVAPPQPQVIEWVTNQGIETDMTGWTGTYGGSSTIEISRSTEEAHSGVGSIKVLGLSGASNRNSGFNDSPDMVSNMQAGVTYSGSVWVKPAFVGQTIVLRLREWTTGWALVTDSKVSYTASTTDWAEITNAITAKQDGTRLAFIVYGADIDAGEYFYADDFSLTTPSN